MTRKYSITLEKPVPEDNLKEYYLARIGKYIYNVLESAEIELRAKERNQIIGLLKKLIKSNPRSNEFDLNIRIE